MNRVLLTGATGLIGSHLLRMLIDDPRIDEIIAPTRRALPALRKVVNLVEADLTDVLLPLESSLDAVFCCLGTTRKQAGSKAAFIHVDYTLVVDTGLCGLRLGAKQMLVVSAHGAHRQSPFFYNRVKGEMENALRHQGWPHLTLVRPSLLLGERDEKRTGESLITPLFALLPGNWRSVPAHDVAQCLHHQAFMPAAESVKIIESADIPRRSA
jgi:uncharacterized protein YbjT (DUF2867 family)